MVLVLLALLTRTFDNREDGEEGVLEGEMRNRNRKRRFNHARHVDEVRNPQTAISCRTNSTRSGYSSAHLQADLSYQHRKENIVEMWGNEGDSEQYGKHHRRQVLPQ